MTYMYKCLFCTYLNKAIRDLWQDYKEKIKVGNKTHL